MSCPDIKGIISFFKISWGKINGDLTWFRSKVEFCVREMYLNGRITEEFYDSCSFRIDRDMKGNLYPLTSEADHLVRNIIMWYKENIKRKNDRIHQFIEIAEKGNVS